MSTQGLVFMLIAWAIVGSLVVYAFSKVLGSKKYGDEEDKGKEE